MQKILGEYEIQEEKTFKTNKFLEKGRITFFYRPRVGFEEARSIDDVQRFYLLLQPIPTVEMHGVDRLIVIPKKRLPHIDAHEKVRLFIHLKDYAFVWKSGPLSKLKPYLDMEEYETVSKGHRVVERARICGYGVYGIIEKENKTYLAYVLEIPEMLGRYRLVNYR